MLYVNAVACTHIPVSTNQNVMCMSTLKGNGLAIKEE